MITLKLRTFDDSDVDTLPFPALYRERAQRAAARSASDGHCSDAHFERLLNSAQSKLDLLKRQVGAFQFPTPPDGPRAA